MVEQRRGRIIHIASPRLLRRLRVDDQRRIVRRGRGHRQNFPRRRADSNHRAVIIHVSQLVERHILQRRLQRQINVGARWLLAHQTLRQRSIKHRRPIQHIVIAKLKARQAVGLAQITLDRAKHQRISGVVAAVLIRGSQHQTSRGNLPTGGIQRAIIGALVTRIVRIARKDLHILQVGQQHHTHQQRKQGRQTDRTIHRAPPAAADTWPAVAPAGE